jgi:hypothetical protein
MPGADLERWGRLAIAWKLSLGLNQLFSPLPPALVWWVWLGLPSPFWLLTGATLGLFARNGLYGSTAQVKNYVKAGQLISLLYLAALVAVYFHDPKLDPPRSLFFSAWSMSVSGVILARLVTNVTLRSWERTHTQHRVFIIAPARRIRLLANTVEKRASYHVVGAALALYVEQPCHPAGHSGGPGGYGAGGIFTRRQPGLAGLLAVTAGGHWAALCYPPAGKCCFDGCSLRWWQGCPPCGWMLP